MAEKTTQEKIEYLSKQEQQRNAFAQLKDALQLINLEKIKPLHLLHIVKKILEHI